MARVQGWASRRNRESVIRRGAPAAAAGMRGVGQKQVQRIERAALARSGMSRANILLKTGFCVVAEPDARTTWAAGNGITLERPPQWQGFPDILAEIGRSDFLYRHRNPLIIEG